MNATRTTKSKAPAAPRKRGRKQTNNSVRMSRAMYIMRNVDGMEYIDIAAFYNKQKRRQDAGKHFTLQAVFNRCKMYALQFPADAAQILGQAPAVVQAAHIVREHSRTVNERELVNA